MKGNGMKYRVIADSAKLLSTSSRKVAEQRAGDAWNSDLYREVRIEIYNGYAWEPVTTYRYRDEEGEAE